MRLHEFCALADCQIKITAHDHGYSASFDSDWEGLFDDARLWPYLDKLEGGGSFFGCSGKTPNDALTAFIDRVRGKKLAFKKAWDKKRRYIDMPAELTM